MFCRLFNLFLLFLISFLSSAVANEKTIFDYEYETTYINPDMGLFPSNDTSAKHTHLLPRCKDVDHIETVPGFKDHQGRCLGTIYNQIDEDLPQALTILSEFIDEDSLIRVVERNPRLMSLAAFLNYCRPMGGILSPDKLRCSFRVHI